ncbi:hypothetical protein EDB85DRAFT_2156508 [Lactarius pseudohatsudake]|nr:hypothetical protein EDB85DRAFT_2156508 [Lactarius pseudohatsudake]
MCSPPSPRRVPDHHDRLPAKVEGLLAIEVVSVEEDLMTNNLSPTSASCSRLEHPNSPSRHVPADYYGAIASSSLGGGKRLRPGYVDGRGAVRRMIPGRGSRLRVPRAAPPADARIPISVEVAEAFAKAWGAAARSVVALARVRCMYSLLLGFGLISQGTGPPRVKAMTRPLQFAAAAYLHFVNLESQIRGFV